LRQDVASGHRRCVGGRVDSERPRPEGLSRGNRHQAQNQVRTCFTGGRSDSASLTVATRFNPRLQCPPKNGPRAAPATRGCRGEALDRRRLGDRREAQRLPAQPFREALLVSGKTRGHRSWEPAGHGIRMQVRISGKGGGSGWVTDPPPLILPSHGRGPIARFQGVSIQTTVASVPGTSRGLLHSKRDDRVDGRSPLVPRARHKPSGAGRKQRGSSRSSLRSRNWNGKKTRQSTS